MNFDAFGTSGMIGDFSSTPFISSNPLPPPPPLALDSALEEAQQWCNISIGHQRTERDLFCDQTEDIPDFGLTSPSVCLLETPPVSADSRMGCGSSIHGCQTTPIISPPPHPHPHPHHIHNQIPSPPSSHHHHQNQNQTHHFSGAPSSPAQGRVSPVSSRRGASHGVSDTDSSCSSSHWENPAATATPQFVPNSCPSTNWENLKPQWDTLAVHPSASSPPAAVSEATTTLEASNAPATAAVSSVPSTPCVDFRALYEGAQSTIDSLNEQLARACARIAELESQRPQMAALSSPSMSQPSLPLSQKPADAATALSVSLAEPLPKIWYADRPFPQFEVCANIPESLSLEMYKVKVGLVDGNGKVSECLGGQAQNHKFVFELDQSGRAVVTGLRITSVSSKCGGSFSLTVTLITPHNPSCAHLVSDPIQVLSYRLFHSPKVDNSELSGNDRVFKIKGIGNLYAKRFMSIGIVTVADLAALDTSPTSNQCDAVLEQLRKDRGALTKAKFLKHIEMAREIVLRSDKSKKRTTCSSMEASSFSSPPPSRKRVCV